MRRAQVVKASRAVGRAFLRAAMLVLALAVLAGVLRGGGRYLYCPAMHAVMDAACCGAHRDTADDAPPADSVNARDCCEEHVRPSLPPASTTATSGITDAMPLATSTPVAPPVALAPRPPARVVHHERAGPRSAAQRRAELMVFLN